MKRFLIKIFLLSIPILIPVGYYLCFLHPHFQKLADNGYCNLSSLGFILFDEDYTERVFNDYPEAKQWLVSEYDNQKFRDDDEFVLTIGDSFSQRGVVSYSSYLAYLNSMRVENLTNTSFANPFNIFVNLFSNNKKNLPKVIIIESVERHLVDRLLELDFKNGDIDNFMKGGKTSKHKERESELNDFHRLAKRTTDYYLNLFTPERKRPVRHLNLKDELFSCKGAEKDFYFYEKEITITNTINEIDIAAHKLDSLFLYAERRGIKLLVLVAADAYDVYQSYIVENPYPPKTVLEELSSRITNPCYIDSKRLFMPYLEQGVKDIYWATDTHWSPVGAKIVAEEIARKLDSLAVCKVEK